MARGQLRPARPPQAGALLEWGSGWRVSSFGGRRRAPRKPVGGPGAVTFAPSTSRSRRKRTSLACRSTGGSGGGTIGAKEFMLRGGDSDGPLVEGERGCAAAHAGVSQAGGAGSRHCRLVPTFEVVAAALAGGAQSPPRCGMPIVGHGDPRQAAAARPPYARRCALLSLFALLRLAPAAEGGPVETGSFA